MGQSTRFDDSEKTRLIDNAAIGIDDNPVVGQKSIDCVRVIVGNRSREIVFQFQQFFLHRMFKEQSIRLTSSSSAAPSASELCFHFILHNLSFNLFIGRLAVDSIALLGVWGGRE